MRLGALYALTLFAAAMPAHAATTIRTGSYGSGNFVADSGDYALGPGRYRFTLRFTTAPLYQASEVEKTTTTNFFCVDPDGGAGEFACGGDNVPTTIGFDEVTPTVFQANLTVDGLRNVTFDSPPIVRYEEFDTCCGFRVEFEAVDPGRYTLSVAAVPEPAGWALMIGGMGLVGSALRRHRSRVALPA